MKQKDIQDFHDNDAVPSASVKKNTITVKEKVFTVIGIIVLICTVAVSIFLIQWRASQTASYEDDEQQICGYWYTEDGSVCWQFEDSLMRKYSLDSSKEKFELSGSNIFRMFPENQKLIVSSGGMSLPFDYTLSDKILTLTAGETTLVLSRGKKPPIKN